MVVAIELSYSYYTGSVLLIPPRVEDICRCSAANQKLSCHRKAERHLLVQALAPKILRHC